MQRVWIVDPEAQTLEVLRVTEARRWETIAVHGDDDRVRAPPSKRTSSSWPLSGASERATTGYDYSQASYFSNCIE